MMKHGTAMIKQCQKTMSNITMTVQYKKKYMTAWITMKSMA